MQIYDNCFDATMPNLQVCFKKKRQKQNNNNEVLTLPRIITHICQKLTTLSDTTLQMHTPFSQQHTIKNMNFCNDCRN